MEKKRCFGCMQLKVNSPICEHCGFNEHVQNESHQLPMGTVLRGQYMVGKALGQGGFGITYLGWDLNLDIPIAIKEYYPNSIVNRDATHNPALTGVATNMMDMYISTRQRFLREAKVLAMLRNIPNIVQVHNFFEENNTAYIVMEYVKGIDLRRYMNLRGGRLTVEEALTILKPVMEALARVHDQGIVHRDISPDNIMMMPDGTPKLLDFGAVRNVESADAEQELQHSTEAILKHGFAPMEQYQKRGALGPWTDEYAMCATIYYSLTGRVPPDAPQRMMEDVHPAWEKIPGLTARQRVALEKGMSLRGKDRYASVRELMDALYGAAPQPVTQPEPIAATMPVEPMEMPPVQEAEEPLYTAPMVTTPVEHVELPEKKKKKSGGLMAGLAAVAVLLVAGFAALGILPKPEVHEPPATEAPVITTEAPETTAPPETTEATTAPTEPPAWMDNVLMPQAQHNGWNNSYYSPAFKQILRGTVRSVTFLDTLKDVPDDRDIGSGLWDVSLNQDGSVLAWVTYLGDNIGLYDMYIAGEGGVLASDCSFLFYEFSNLEEINFGTAFHTDGITSMEYMFAFCEKLTTVDLENLDTSGVRSMEYMFKGCTSITDMNVGNWNTSNVTNMSNMFSNLDSLTKLDVSDWDVSNVTDMSYMFWQSWKITDLVNWDFSGWDISRVENYENFMNKGKTINGQPWEDFFKNPTKPAAPATETTGDAWKNNVLMAQTNNHNGYGSNQNTAFRTPIIRNSVKSITFLDTLKDAPEEYFWDVSENQDGSVIAWVYQDGIMYDMYIAAEGGINAKHCDWMFYTFLNLERIDFGNAFHTDEATSMHVMFWNCGKLTDLDISGFNTGNVKDMGGMFENCQNLTKLDLSSWDTSNVTDMGSMFSNCFDLTELNVHGWDTSNVTSMSYMFRCCYNITDIDLSGWDVSKVEEYENFSLHDITINGQPWEEFFQ